VIRQGRRHDPPGGGIKPDVQLLPGAPTLGSVLFDQPLAGPEHRQPGAYMRRSTSSIFSIAFFLFQ
jgi:hypothetical protein